TIWRLYRLLVPLDADIRRRVQAHAQAGEDGRAARGAGGAGSGLNPDAQHVGHNLSPETALQTTAGAPNHLRRCARLHHELQPLTLAEGDTFQYRPDQVFEPVAEVESEKDSSRAGVDVRRALAAEVGQKHQPVRARRRVAGALHQPVVRRVT